MLKAAHICKVLDAEESAFADLWCLSEQGRHAVPNCDGCYDMSTRLVSVGSNDKIAVKSSDGRRDAASCVDCTFRRRDGGKKWRWFHFGVCANLVDLQDLDEDGGGCLVQSGCRIRPVPKT